MNTFSQLEALQKIASSREDQKILVTLHEDSNVGTAASLLISMEGSIAFYQLNESYIDDFGLCHETNPIHAHKALEIIQAYHFTIDAYLKPFVDTVVPDEKPASETMDHREYAHLERTVQNLVDQAYQNSKLVFDGEKNISFLCNVFRNLADITHVLQTHRVKDPAKKLQRIKSILPLAKHLARDA